MIKINISTNRPTTHFEYKGLEYLKTSWEFFYSNKVSQGYKVDTDAIRVGIKHVNTGEVLIVPVGISSYLDSTDTPFTSYVDFMSEIGSIVNFNNGTTFTLTQKVDTFDDLVSGGEIGELAYVDSPQGTSWLPSTLGGTYYPQGWYVWTGGEWVSDRNSIANKLEELITADGLMMLDNRVIVKQSNAISILGGTIDSSKEYFIDGKIDMGITSIQIPSGGFKFKGYNSSDSGLYSSADNYVLFEGSDAGNILGENCYLSVTGNNSMIHNLISSTGNEVVEYININYENCSSLGILDGYRQGLELNTARFGGTPTLELKGAWSGGFRITTSIVRGLSSGMTEPLFKAGVGFTMASRFLTDINCDLPVSAALLDFSPSNFIGTNRLELRGTFISRDGVFNPTGGNITPNISHADKESYWSDNVGIFNTSKGVEINVSSETTTAVSTVNTWYDLQGTFAASNAQHFDNPTNGVMRFLDESPSDIRVSGQLVLESSANRVIELRLDITRDSDGSKEYSRTWKRVINNSQGQRDVGYFDIADDILLYENDLVKIQVRNTTDSSNITAEQDSYVILKQI